jgi:hypothetical protein
MNLKRKEENKNQIYENVGWLVGISPTHGWCDPRFCFCVMFATSFTDKAMGFLQLLSGQMYLCSKEDLNSLP